MSRGGMRREDTVRGQLSLGLDEQKRYVAIVVVFTEPHPCGRFPLGQRCVVDADKADAYEADVRRWCADGTWPPLASIERRAA